MRTYLLRLLCLTLALCCFVLSAPAETADVPAETVDLSGTGVYSLFTMEDVLYAQTWNGLYRFDENDANPVLLPMGGDGQFFLRMTAHGQTLYGVDGDNRLYAMTLESDAVTVPKLLADLPVDMDETSAYASCAGLVADDSAVYVLIAVTPDGTVYPTTTLYRVALDSGEVTFSKAEHLTDLCDYKDGQLLARRYNPEGFGLSDREQAMLVAVGKDTMEPVVLTTLESDALAAPAYDAANDFIYLSSPGQLVRLDASFTPTVCAVMAQRYQPESTSALVRGGDYLIATSDEPLGYARASTDPSAMPDRVLKLSMSYMDDVTTAFIKEHPDIRVEMAASDTFSSDAIISSMISGSDAYDVYNVYLNFLSFPMLRDKGYCADLSASDVLTSVVNRMYPNMTAACFDSAGRLMALPYALNVQGWGYSPTSLKKLGLTEADLPQTYTELMDFLVRWADELADNNAGLTLFEHEEAIWDFRSEVYTLFQTAYMDDYLLRGEPLTFDTPLFRSLLAKLDEVTPALETLNPKNIANNGYTIGGAGDATSLLYSHASFSPKNYRLYDFVPLMLKLDETSEPSLDGTERVLILNPNSKNVDPAMTYLEYRAEHLSAVGMLSLYPDYSEPIEASFYQDNLKSMQNYLTELQEGLATAEEADKKNLEDQIAYVEADLANAENERWDVSPESIAVWQKLAPTVVVDSDPILSGKDYGTLLQRYLGGELDAERYITELERLLNMIRMENE